MNVGISICLKWLACTLKKLWLRFIVQWILRVFRMLSFLQNIDCHIIFIVILVSKGRHKLIIIFLKLLILHLQHELIRILELPLLIFLFLIINLVFYSFIVKSMNWLISISHIYFTEIRLIKWLITLRIQITLKGLARNLNIVLIFFDYLIH